LRGGNNISGVDFEPRIIAFCCNWCAYAGADLAGVGRLQMPPSFRIIRTMCSGRVDLYFILRALESGADGIIVMGCHPGDCHYVSGNLKAERRIKFLKHILEQMGMSDRVELYWVAASEGSKFQEVIIEFTDRIRKLGPSDIRLKPSVFEKSKEMQKRNFIHDSLIAIARELDFKPGQIDIPEEEIMEGYGFPRYDKEKCIGCGACFAACPEQVITMTDLDGIRTIGHYYFNCRTCKRCEEICPQEAIEITKGFDLQAFLSSEPVKNLDLQLRECGICGNYFAPEMQLENLRETILAGDSENGTVGVEFPADIFNICPDCKREIAAKRLNCCIVQKTPLEEEKKIVEVL